MTRSGRQHDHETGQVGPGSCKAGQDVIKRPLFTGYASPDSQDRRADVEKQVKGYDRVEQIQTGEEQFKFRSSSRHEGKTELVAPEKYYNCRKEKRHDTEPPGFGKPYGSKGHNVNSHEKNG